VNVNLDGQCARRDAERALEITHQLLEAAPKRPVPGDDHSNPEEGGGRVATVCGGGKEGRSGGASKSADRCKHGVQRDARASLGRQTTDDGHCHVMRRLRSQRRRARAQRLQWT
jgi:hypothetical protein